MVVVVVVVVVEVVEIVSHHPNPEIHSQPKCPLDFAYSLTFSR